MYLKKHITNISKDIFEDTKLSIEKLLKDTVASTNYKFIKDGETALGVATIIGDIKVIKYLLSCKADINGVSKVGQQPIHLAATQGSLKVFKYLVEDNKADINAITLNGSTPLSIVINWNHIVIVRYSLNKGANICDTKNQKLFETLNSFIAKGVFECLLDKIIELDTYNSIQNNLMMNLYSAVEKENIEDIGSLLDKIEKRSHDFNNYKYLFKVFVINPNLNCQDSNVKEKMTKVNPGSVLLKNCRDITKYILKKENPYIVKCFVNKLEEYYKDINNFSKIVIQPIIAEAVESESDQTIIKYLVDKLIKNSVKEDVLNFLNIFVTPQYEEIVKCILDTVIETNTAINITKEDLMPIFKLAVCQDCNSIAEYLIDKISKESRRF
ncbi:MAG: ankyrin repeat domain-containing protein [Candidatus Rickettsia vulgarisii]